VLSTVVSAGVTIDNSRQAARSSERWEKAQIALLNTLREEANAARRDIAKLQEVAVSVQNEIATRRVAKPRR